MEMAQLQQSAVHNHTAAMLEMGTSLLSRTAEQTRKLTDVETQVSPTSLPPTPLNPLHSSLFCLTSQAQSPYSSRTVNSPKKGKRKSSQRKYCCLILQIHALLYM